MRKFLAFLLCVVCLGVQPAHAATYTYLRPEWSDTGRDPYGVALLKLAFAKARACHTLVYNVDPMKQARAIYELENDTGALDIMITMTSAEREARLLAVPIPLTKGLLGWRVALVRKDRQQLFADVRTAEQLKAFVAGQGHDWPDVGILRASGLPVHVSSAYDGMFKMLEANRIDYFPRAVQQVFDEVGRYPGLAIEPNLVLRYPTDAYFFVNRKNAVLADEIRRGLEAAVADGSFDRLFYSYFAPKIAAAGLERRHVVDLPNPLVGPSLPLARKSLWFSLDEMRRPAVRAALKPGAAEAPPPCVPTPPR
jgi:ABC-type amino acid transport substrate-binding protein